jgi:CxxC motif-containing protein (DUF1111 family)
MNAPAPIGIEPYRSRHEWSWLRRVSLAGALVCLGSGMFGWSDPTAGMPPPEEQAGTAPGGELLTLVMRPDDPAPLLRLPATSIGGETALGQVLFNADWARDPPRPGVLGPHFDHAGCVACHIEGLPLQNAGVEPPQPIARLLRDEDRARLGEQVNTDAVAGVVPRGEVLIRWVETAGQFTDGTPYRLRRPLATVQLLDPIAAGEHQAADGGGRRDVGPVSLRMPPALFGWGLLEAIDAEFIEDLADPDDADGNGISGRVARVLDRVDGQVRIGRFGWKAEQPSLRQQTAAALANDMGITTGLFPDPACVEAGHGTCAPEVSNHDLTLLVEYQRWLGVPERRLRDVPEVLRGQVLFEDLGCSACHLPVAMTGRDAPVGLADQVIWAYSDLLLHDMGPDLADPALGPDDAAAREWRTAPLWGIGVLEARLPDRGWLHDGRARDLMEAVLWHGGEAAPARERVRALDRAGRAALLAFLRSL